MVYIRNSQAYRRRCGKKGRIDFHMQNPNAMNDYSQSRMNRCLSGEQRNAAACNDKNSHHLSFGSRSTQTELETMRKLVAAATAMSLLALSLPITASAQSTKPPAGSTVPAQSVPAKTTANTSAVKPAKHHAKRHHLRHFVKRHRPHRLAAYKTHRRHHAARGQHHARHHRMHVKRVVSKS
jgi:hypothetical protein